LRALNNQYQVPNRQKKAMVNEAIVLVIFLRLPT
jgi:hypothetical protein